VSEPSEPREQRIGLVRVKLKHKQVLANLVQFYRYDFSAIRGLELTPHGTYSYLYLDHYFVEPSRQAFFIVVDERLAGFAFARRKEGVNELAEFFVMKAFRRRNVGTIAATRLFRKFPGDWSLEFDHNNARAANFWPRVVESVAAGPVERIEQYPPTVDYASSRLNFRVVLDG
jgi:predicted acetyltransferase